MGILATAPKIPTMSPHRFMRSRRGSRTSHSSTGSRDSAVSAAASMSDGEVDNFRSMRGKGGHNSIDLGSHMADDVDDLASRLDDVAHSRELQKNVFDTTGQAYTVLITSNDVRLMHVDEKGHYHFNHFNSEKLQQNSDSDSEDWVKQHWRVIDDEEISTCHVFVDATPSWVTVYHRGGTWQCRRFRGRVWEVENSDRHRPIAKKLPRPGKKPKLERTFRLYGQNNDASDAGSRSSNGSPSPEPLLCANTPGEKGQRPMAHQSFYHDL